ncbi:NAD(P)/FAD-dependent oxidoreductase [bacterium]|nr:NAD(P)/FAD-dependent oxidoreductase [bacterium]
MTQEKYDVVVVGGGPGGSMAAKFAAENGVRVLVLEKDREIGIPVRCGEAVGGAGLREFMEPKGAIISSPIDSFRLISPSGIAVHSSAEGAGYVLNRKVFDQELAILASNAGAKIQTRSYVTGLLFDGDYVCGVKYRFQNQEDREVRAKVVVAADGVEARVGRFAGFKTVTKMKDMETCYQVHLANIDVEDGVCDFLLSNKKAPGGYIWVFPKGNRQANVGIGISGKFSAEKSPKKYLDEYIAERFPNASEINSTLGGVPCDKTLSEISGNGIVLVGDTAHQVNPMTGGGIVNAMKAGRISGKIIATAIKEGNVSKKRLSEYDREWEKTVGKINERFYKIKEFTMKLTDVQLDKTAELLVEMPPEKRTLFNVFKTAVRYQPALIWEVTKIFFG